jgi:hypothetical protein
MAGAKCGGSSFIINSEMKSIELMRGSRVACEMCANKSNGNINQVINLLQPVSLIVLLKSKISQKY